MNGRRVFGIETEYAIAAVTDGGKIWSNRDAGAALVRSVGMATPHLRDSSQTGLFLCNGSRLYMDCGGHPELAGPECHTPADTVRYARAGDLLMLRAAADVMRQHLSLTDFRIFASNVDYGGTGATWRTHESYGHRADPTLVRRCLVPHLVTRLVFAGAGGFNPISYGLEFTLSPRAHHIQHVVSDGTTHDRGIVNTRLEPLGSSSHRQHLICGERLQSDLALFLMVGTTALVVALADTGVGLVTELSDPLEALATVAADPTCRVALPTVAGERLTAVEIQRRLLRQARRHLDQAWMPAWAGEVCFRWQAVLDTVEQGPAAISRSLDWGIKLAAYRSYVERRGLAWESLPLWTQILERLQRLRLGDDELNVPLSSRVVSVAVGQLRAAVENMTPTLRRRGLSWNHLDRFLAVRSEMLELDTRWGQLGPNGLFTQLEQSGVLDHRVPGMESVDEAVLNPPAGGRAGVRGRRIRALAGAGTKATAAWDHIVDYDGRRSLDLSDPLIDMECWRASGAPAPAAPRDDDPATDPSFWDNLARRIRGQRRA